MRPVSSLALFAIQIAIPITILGASVQACHSSPREEEARESKPTAAAIATTAAPAETAAPNPGTPPREEPAQPTSKATKARARARIVPGAANGPAPETTAAPEAANAQRPDTSNDDFVLRANNARKRKMSDEDPYSAAPTAVAKPKMSDDDPYANNANLPKKSEEGAAGKAK